MCPRSNHFSISQTKCNSSKSNFNVVSTVAVKINLCRYNEEGHTALTTAASGGQLEVGRCRLNR